ncbi:hypothetical protein [Amycolatopsis sp. GM8]|uniref:hypothetical protein n=1 Tax=Amycolatopsis sp. GM8 TaxID=2896530 RepID=UPI001F23C207|nr:hypothetical protein [Amycolatopsis sp. GM8]
MGNYEEYQQQLFAEFLRLCDVIDQCARILTQQSPPPVIPGLGGAAAENTEEYVRNLSIDAAKKKDVVWETYTLLGQLHGYGSNVPEAIVQARAKLATVVVHVDDVLGKFDTADQGLSDWEGAGALGVKARLSDLKTFVGNQTTYVAYLDGVLEEYEKLVRTGEANAEELAKNITTALTDAKENRRTAKVEFVLKMFDGVTGTAEAVHSKDPLAVINGLRAIVGAIQERQKVMEATDPERIMDVFRPLVREARDNLAAAGDRLANHFTDLLEDMAKENTKAFFKDAKLNLDILSPGFKSAEFRLKDAADWDDFARAVDKLPKTGGPETQPLGPIAKRLEADRAA